MADDIVGLKLISAGTTNPDLFLNTTATSVEDPISAAISAAFMGSQSTQESAQAQQPSTSFDFEPSANLTNGSMASPQATAIAMLTQLAETIEALKVFPSGQNMTDLAISDVQPTATVASDESTPNRRVQAARVARQSQQAAIALQSMASQNDAKRQDATSDTTAAVAIAQANNNVAATAATDGSTTAALVDGDNILNMLAQPLAALANIL